MAKLRSEKAGLPPGSLVPVSEDPEVATTIQVMVYNADSFSEHCAVAADKIDVGDPSKSDLDRRGRVGGPQGDQGDR